MGSGRRIVFVIVGNGFDIIFGGVKFRLPGQDGDVATAQARPHHVFMQQSLCQTARHVFVIEQQ